mmetsp:Transcript_14222/g.18559  ORF Transcript_14222/g.18559 Transcript_14222/m.18559 type:complete len:113 (+) Transcript_14222:128-466(+)|eukprot:CAMPEP_0198147480 /NCGR_PEP_ID=MMETSP1443-20131203/35974_1 /TAXON_ID=186043 /ORGANISM="Entomoneis sp., Strain CCMP2396" /LENGTH=112 /DNA_ID=CAMNT_0043811835 /DNA_START=101 /DNA_END=439 /DNA_ORIENTATION=+
MAETGSKPTEAASVSLQELQETVSRLSSHTGVEVVIILNRQGDIIAESSKTKENASSPDAAAMVSKLLKMATSFVQSLSADDEVSFLQVRTEQHRELYIAPHEGYVLALARR